MFCQLIHPVAVWTHFDLQHEWHPAKNSSVVVSHSPCLLLPWHVHIWHDVLQLLNWKIHWFLFIFLSQIFLSWPEKILVYLTCSSTDGVFLFLPFCPSLFVWVFFFFSFCDGAGFRHCQHDVSLLCSLFLCWHSACCLSSCISEHWDGVITQSILTLGSHSQGLSLCPITVGRVKTVLSVLDFVFVYIELHLLFYHLDAGNLLCLRVFTHNLLLPFCSAF